MSSSHSSGRSSGKVSPIDDETNEKPAQVAVEHALDNVNTTVMIPNDPVAPAQPAVAPSFLSRIFKKKHSEAKGDTTPAPPKKPEGPKLKLFEIVGVRH